MSTQLSGRELDAAVAEKVMGWKRMTEGEIYPDTFDDVYPNAALAGFDRTRVSDWWYDPLQRNDKNEADATVLAEDPADEDSLVINTLFKRFAPSSDIEAAMLVAEKMYAADWAIEINRSIVIDDDWLVKFSSVEAGRVKDATGFAKTLPEAISRAALSAIQGS